MFGLPPEVTSTLIYTGPGSGSLVAASAAWRLISQQLEQFASQQSSVVSDIPWFGVSDVAMRAASTRITAWAQQTALLAAQMASSAQQASDAFDIVHATITPPAAVYANRILLGELIATNILGQNSTQIAATEAEYSEMWATNTASMAQYQASSAQATGLLTEFQNLLTGIPGLDSVVAPGSNQSTTGLAGLLNLLDGSTGSALGTFIDSNLFTTAIVNSITSSGFYLPSNFLGPFVAFMMGQQPAIAADDGKSGLVFVRPPPQGRPPMRVTVEQPAEVEAQLGVAKSLGPLSAPPSWTKPPDLGVKSPARPDQNVNIMNAAPVVEASGIIPIPLPLPLGLKAGTPPKTDKPPPEYGQKPTVMPKHPYGG
jgi:PPE-repeat protein